MPTLSHSEFDLRGYRFGPGHPVYLSGIETPGLVWRDQDVLNPVAAGVFFGRDYKDVKPWGLKFTITGTDPAEAAENYFALVKAWEARARWDAGTVLQDDSDRLPSASDSMASMFLGPKLVERFKQKTGSEGQGDDSKRPRGR